MLRDATVHTIRSDSQRALALYWLELASGRRFPSFTEFRPDAVTHDPKQLVVWNIEGAGGLRKFRALFQGENIANAFNMSWAGKTMEQVVPISLRRPALDAAKACADFGCMIYMILSTWDAKCNRIDCERLLLPFGADGEVKQLLGSMQLTNVPEAAYRGKALGHFEIHTEITESAKINAGSSFPKIAEAAVQEKRGLANKRRASRRTVRHAARITFSRQSITCTVRDISRTGASIESSYITAIPDQFKMRVELESAERHCIVVWRKKTRIGVKFK